MSFLSELFGNDKVNANKWFSLVESGHSTKVQEYINKSNNIIHSRDVRDQDALMIAASKGYKEIVEMLIRAGAGTNNKNFAGSTALMDAASNGHKEIVEILLKAGADVNQSCRGWTALMDAASNGHKEIVEILLKAGADVNACSKSGATPLTCAVSKGDKDSVEFLIKAGADFTKQDERELTALRIAHNLGFKEIEELLYKTCVDSNWEFKKPLNPPFEMTIEASVDVNNKDVYWLAQVGVDHPIFKLLKPFTSPLAGFFPGEEEILKIEEEILNAGEDGRFILYNCLRDVFEIRASNIDILVIITSDLAKTTKDMRLVSLLIRIIIEGLDLVKGYAKKLSWQPELLPHISGRDNRGIQCYGWDDRIYFQYSDYILYRGILDLLPILPEETKFTVKNELISVFSRNISVLKKYLAQQTRDEARNRLNSDIQFYEKLHEKLKSI